MAHRYVGLAMAVFLIVAGLTGSLIAFYPELDAALNPELFDAPAPTADAKRIDPLTLRERLASNLPASARADFVTLATEADRALVFYVEPDQSVGERADTEYFVDPYSGRVLGSRRWGDPFQGAKTLMTFIYRLHYSLALGSVGIYLFGIVALLWTLDCFVGAYLTFPPARRRQASSPSKSWFVRWKPAWLLRKVAVVAS